MIEQAADTPSALTQSKEAAPPSVASAVSKRTLHVLTITPFYPTRQNESGGCFVAEPLSELLKTGLQSTVFAVDAAYREAPHAMVSAPAATWYRYPSLPGGLGLASAGKGLYWRLRDDVSALHAESRIDLIHAHGPLPCGHASWLLSRRLKVPYVVTVHGLDAFSAMQVGGWAGEWCRRASQRVFQTARRVIGVSRRVCEQVEKGTFGTTAASVVYNGVDPAAFMPGSETPIPTLLTVGNLILSKGHELVVRSLAALKPEFPSLRWEVIGEGPELDRIRYLAQVLGVLGNIRFLGRRSRQAVADACRRCTLFVLPSSSEGLGCVYLEAMSCGKPAIGCFGQGIAEVIRHGENGWLVPPGGLAELIEALRVLLRDADQRAQIGSAARQSILAGYTLQHQAQRLMEIYRECAG